MTWRFGPICAAGAGAIVALGLLCAPAFATADLQKVYVDCLGDKVIELCSDALAAGPAPGETAKPPTFETIVGACAAERSAFVELVRTRNLAAGRTAVYAERRVVRHTRRLEGLVHDLFDKCIETTP